AFSSSCFSSDVFGQRGRERSAMVTAADQPRAAATTRTVLVERECLPEAPAIPAPDSSRRGSAKEPTPTNSEIGENHGTASKRSDHAARLRSVQYRRHEHAHRAHG